MKWKALILTWFLFLAGNNADAFGAESKHYLISEESQIGFDARSLMHGFEGEVSALTGEFDIQWSAPPSLEFARLVIPAMSLMTGNHFRDSKMRRHHLETDQFPLIEFKVTQCVAIKGEANTTSEREYSLKGELSLHGVTREIFFPVSVRYNNPETINISGNTYLKLSDFQIPIPSALGFIKMEDEVGIYFNIIGKAEKEKTS